MKNSKLLCPLDLYVRYSVIILIIATIFSAGCAKKEPAKPKEVVEEAGSTDEAATDTVQQKVLSFNLEGLSEKGDKKWEVKGESAQAVSENEVKLKYITAKSYGDEALATLTADEGIYDKSKNNVKLEKNVVVTVENTREFAKSYAGIPNQVAGAAEAKEDEPAKKMSKTIITCDGEVEFDYEKNLAYFDKNVKVTSDDGNIDADRITINLDPKTKKVKEIIADGNVKITRGENATYSEKATYIEDEKRVILTGKPKLVIYQEGVE